MWMVMAALYPVLQVRIILWLGGWRQGEQGGGAQSAEVRSGA